MSITQDGRLLRIDTPLGKDYLLLNELQLTEELSDLFYCKVQLLHGEETKDFEPTEIDAPSILGQNVTITLEQRDGTSRKLNGIVNSFSRGDRDTRFSYYQATIVPKIWLLTQTIQSRIFQHKSVPEIVKEVLEGFDFSMQVQGDFKPRDYCVQYRESDFQFVCRILEEEGIYFYFEHSDTSHKMIIADTPESHQDAPTKNTITYIIKLDTEEKFVPRINNLWADYKLQTGKVAYRDYHFQTPTNRLETQQPSFYPVANNQNMEIYDYPGGYARKYDEIDRMGEEDANGLEGMFPDKQRTVKNTMNALDSQYNVLSGTGNCCSLIAGHKFKLIEHPNKKLNVQYIITSITHEAHQSPNYHSNEEEGEPYNNQFEIIPYGQGVPPYCPPLKTPKPIMQGCQTGIVVGPSGEEIFTDKYGRVKVEFHWNRDGKADPGSSCWIRVAKDLAGNKYGSMYIPRIGQEVIIDFIGGDPDRPIITGSVYNDQTMPHYELPKYKTLSYIKTRTSPDDGKGF
ncbi:MAG: type VI secretion system Vgr family protein, partial [Aridibacter sp.]